MTLLWKFFLGSMHLFRGLQWGKGVGKITHCLKLLRIILKTWNMLCKYTHIVSGNLFNTWTPLILLMSALFLKKSVFLAKVVPPLSAVVWDLCERLFVLFSVFVRLKVKINENISITDHVSGIWLLDCSKLVINWKKWWWRHNLLTWRHCQISLTLLCFSCQV